MLQQMPYAQQLDDYEEAVMRKRLEEMPEQGGCSFVCCISFQRVSWCCGRCWGCPLSCSHAGLISHSHLPRLELTHHRACLPSCFFLPCRG